MAYKLITLALIAFPILSNAQIILGAGFMGMAKFEQQELELYPHVEITGSTLGRKTQFEMTAFFQHNKKFILREAFALNFKTTDNQYLTFKSQSLFHKEQTFLGVGLMHQWRCYRASFAVGTNPNYGEVQVQAMFLWRLPLELDRVVEIDCYEF